jgi:hypothetical protein
MMITAPVLTKAYFVQCLDKLIEAYETKRVGWTRFALHQHTHQYPEGAVCLLGGLKLVCPETMGKISECSIDVVRNNEELAAFYLGLFDREDIFNLNDRKMKSKRQLLLWLHDRSAALHAELARETQMQEPPASCA